MKQIGIFLYCLSLLAGCNEGRNFNKALECENAGDYETAIEYLNRVLESTPCHYMAYINRGTDRSQLGDIEGAIADYTKAIQVDSTKLVAYMNRAGNMKRLEKYSEALADYNFVLGWMGFDPNALVNIRGLDRLDFMDRDDLEEPQYEIFDALFERGIALYHLDSFQLAMRDFDYCITNDKYLAECYYWRGFVYLKLNDRLAACKDLREAMSLGNKDAIVDYEQYCSCN